MQTYSKSIHYFWNTCDLRKLPSWLKLIKYQSYIPNPQVSKLAYSAFPGKLGLFLDKHSVFMRYLFCWYIESEFTLPAKLQTEEDGLRAPLALEAKL